LILYHTPNTSTSKSYGIFYDKNAVYKANLIFSCIHCAVVLLWRHKCNILC